jgi:hypothetical protein
MSGVRLADLGDFLPLIILILISAWANHAKKKKEEELARKQAEARRKAQGGQAAEAQPQRPRPVQEVEEEEDEDWTAGEWEEEVRTGETPYAAPRGEDRGAIRAEPERQYDPMRKLPRDQRAEPRDRVPPGPVKAKAEKTRAQAKAQDQDADKAPKAAETAKDFLTQIAKELGLELPPGTSGKPAPKPQAPKPAPPPPPPPRPSYQAPSPDESRFRATEAARAKPSMPRIEEFQPYATASAARGAGITPLELAGPEALRQAFILKTILDKPLARRPRSHGPLTDR